MRHFVSVFYNIVGEKLQCNFSVHFSCYSKVFDESIIITDMSSSNWNFCIQGTKRISLLLKKKFQWLCEHFFLHYYSINVLSTEIISQITIGPLCTQQSKYVLLNGLHASNYVEFSHSSVWHSLQLDYFNQGYSLI